MKVSYSKLTAVALLTTLAGCGEKDSHSPRIDAPFNQQLTLRYQQSAALPSQTDPELILTLDDVLEYRCPEGANCLQPGKVETLVTVQGRAGTGQAISLKLDPLTPGTDSAVVQANARTYTLVLEAVTPHPKLAGDVSKKDKRVTLTVRRR